jgi:hypothetical protein
MAIFEMIKINELNVTIWRHSKWRNVADFRQVAIVSEVTIMAPLQKRAVK